MKRKLIMVAVFVLIAWGFTSCEKTCKFCKKVFYDGSGNYIREDAGGDYCGIELIAIDGKTMDLGSLGSAQWLCN